MGKRDLEEDENFMEYVTAASEEVQPVEPEERSADEGQTQLVAQLQARIMELESQQKTPTAPKPPLHFEPAPRTMPPSVLFGDPGRTSGRVDASTLSKLQDLAGPAPGRLTKIEAKPKSRPVGSLAQDLHAGVDAGVLPEEELAALTMNGGDPLQRILAPQPQQTAMLSQRLLPTQRPLGHHRRRPGQRRRKLAAQMGFADVWLAKHTLEDVNGVGRAIMFNAASDLGLAETQIGSGLMRSDEYAWAIIAC